MDLVWIAAVALVVGAALSFRVAMAERFIKGAQTPPWLGNALLAFMLAVAVLVMAVAVRTGN